MPDNNAGVKVSGLPVSESFKDLYALGVDEDNRSVKVPLEAVGSAAGEAQSAAADARIEAQAAHAAAESATTAAAAASGVVDSAAAAVTEMWQAISDTGTAAAAANAAATAANQAAGDASAAAESATASAGAANTAAKRAEAAAVHIEEVSVAAEAASHAPYIHNGSWMVWNPAHGKYENAGPATGTIAYPSFSINDDQELVVRDASPKQFRVEDGCLIYSTNR